MQFSAPNSAAPRAVQSPSARWLRRLAAPIAGILLIPASAGITAGSASALASGTISVAPNSGTVVSLQGSQLSSKTALDLKVPVSLPLAVGIQLRSADTGTGYRSKARVAADGVVTVSLSRVISGVETALGAPIATGFTAKAGESIHLQGLVAGLNPVTTYVRAWKSGATTPDWQLAARVYSAERITTAGQVRLWAYLSSGASPAATISFCSVVTEQVTAASVAAEPVKNWVTIGSPTPTPTPTPTMVVPVKPNADTTGVKAGTVTGNKFGPNRAVSSCAFTAYPAVTLTQNNNTHELTGAPINPLVVIS